MIQILKAIPILWKGFQRRLPPALALFAIVAISMPATAQSSLSFGFFAKGQTAAGLSIYPARSNGSRSGIFTLVARNLVDCRAQFPPDQTWSDLCALANSSQANTLRLVYTVRPEKGPLEMSGEVVSEALSFPFFISLRLNSDDDLLSVAAFSQWNGPRAAVSFSDSQQKFMAIKNQAGNFSSLAAGFQSGGVKSRISVERLGSDAEHIGQLDFSFDTGVESDCLDDIGKSAQQSGWQRFCEIADKDGPFFLRGPLNSIENDTAYAGTVTMSRNGQRYHLMVSDMRDDYALVAVRLASEPAFTASNVTENVIFDNRSAGVALSSSSTPDLTSGIWRVPQEELPNFGMEMEVEFERKGDSYEAKAIAWYRGDTANISGYCYDSSAMAAICERVAKDGPLELHLDLPTRIDRVAFGLRGNAVASSGWHDDPFAVDVYQGSSIGDWGDAEPNGLYIRLRRPDVNPGEEPLAYLKLVPVRRDRVTLEDLAERGTYNRPATNTSRAAPADQPIDPQTAQTDSCDSVSQLIAGMSDRDERRRALDVLAHAGFWGGILPEDDASCARASQALADAGLSNTGSTTARGEPSREPVWRGAERPPVKQWPFSKTVRASKPLGNKQESIEIFRQTDGMPVVRIPRFERCFFSNQPACEHMKLYPGDYPVKYLASNEGHTYGFFAVGSQGFILKLEDNGKGDVLGLISFWTEGLMPLGSLQ